MSEPDPQLLAGFVENQRRELEIRASELVLKAQQDKHGFEHAQRVLEAQLKDRDAQRTFAVKYAWHRYVFVGFLVAAAFVFLAVLAMNGHAALAGEILKATVYLAAGAIGGFFYGRNKKPQNQQDIGPGDTE